MDNTKLALLRGEQDAVECSERLLVNRKIWQALTGNQRKQLIQLVEQGPVWDGDVYSKAARGDLFDLGLASRAVVKGKDGFTVANYRGYAVYLVANSDRSIVHYR